MTAPALLALQIHLDAGLDLAELDRAIEHGLSGGADVAQMQRDRQRVLALYSAGSINEGRAVARQLALQLALAKLHKLAVAQPLRRKGKPGTSEMIDEHGVGRNEQIKRRHAELLTARGRHGTTSAVAAEFGLSTRQVRNILRS
jgi:hypothetical protein